MVLLGGIKLCSGQYLSHDRLRKTPRGCQLCPGCFSLTLLFRIEIKNRTAILGTTIAELAVGRKRIDSWPERRQQLGETGSCRIKAHLDCFYMPRFARRHLLVGGIGRFPANISGSGGYHARHLVEICLGAPETASGKDRDTDSRRRRCSDGRGAGWRGRVGLAASIRLAACG